MIQDDKFKDQLQSFADANGLGINIEEMLNNISAGDYVAITSAAENDDNAQIVQIMHRYKASLNEMLTVFTKSNFTLNEFANKVNDASYRVIEEGYHQHVPAALFSTEYLTEGEMKALFYEAVLAKPEIDTDHILAELEKLVYDLDNETLPVEEDTNVNKDPNAMRNDLIKDIQSNLGNQNFEVGVNDGNTVTPTQVVGLQQGRSPEETLVVTADGQSGARGEVEVRNIDDLSIIDENDESEEQLTQNSDMHEILKFFQRSLAKDTDEEETDMVDNVEADGEDEVVVMVEPVEMDTQMLPPESDSKEHAELELPTPDTVEPESESEGVEFDFDKFMKVMDYLNAMDQQASETQLEDEEPIVQDGSKPDKMNITSPMRSNMKNARADHTGMIPDCNDDIFSDFCGS